MTIFSDNPHDRRMERLMMTVPNFAPRGVGFRFTEAQVFITATAATPTEILTATMRQIRCPPFRKRFNEYIESEEKPMTYINEKHRARFTLAAKNVHRENYALLSALYLLTADPRLWSCCKHHINNGCVFFENIKLNNCSERAYAVYCAAKDLTLGTKHITAYIETWFDVDKKFGINTASEDGTWLNMYAKYNPFADTLRIECEISRDSGSSYFDYEPTIAESQLIKDMIAEKLMQGHGRTPQEFCEDVCGIEIGGMMQ